MRAMVRPGQEKDPRVPAQCQQCPVDLTDVESLKKIVAGSSAVVYCAGSVRGGSPADFATANVKGVQVMIEVLEGLTDAPPLLLISSLAATRPQLSDYARSKHDGEQILFNSPQLPWTIIRPPAVYGPGDREMLALLKMARRGLIAHTGPVDQRLSLLYVEDLAEAVVAWLFNWRQCRGQIYAIDDGRPGGYNWKAIAEAVGRGRYRLFRIPRALLEIIANINLFFSRVMGYSPMLTPGKVRELVQTEWLGDNASYSAATLWQPRFDLHQGTRTMFEPGNPGISP